jgi:hypothetical protein
MMAEKESPHGVGTPGVNDMSALNRLLHLAVRSDDARKLAAWNAVPSVPGTLLKIDCDRRRIRWEEYGQNSAYGWHIDHAAPTILGGPDTIWNLRARHWLGNCRAGGQLSGVSKLFDM